LIESDTDALVDALTLSEVDTERLADSLGPRDAEVDVESLADTEAAAASLVDVEPAAEAVAAESLVDSEGAAD